MTTDERSALAADVNKAIQTIGGLFKTFAGAAGAPERFAMGVYDASDAETSVIPPAAVADRAIAEFKFGEEQWGERDYLNTARGKVGVALRTRRNTGDLARGAPDLFQEGEPKFPGAVLGEVRGKPIAVGASGLRGPEDEALAQLLLQLVMRLTA